MKHVGAVVLAVVLVVAAIVVRNRLADDPVAHVDPWTPESTATLVCADELANVCQALAASTPGLTVKMESVAVTEKRLITATDLDDLDFDAWLAPSSFPAMVTDQRSRALAPEILAPPSPVLARSPLTMVIWNELEEILTEACPGGEITWKCVGSIASTPWEEHGGDPSWGAITAGYASPENTATGLAVVAQATASWFGTTDFASNDFSDSDFRAWLQQLEHGIVNRPRAPRTPLDEMLTKGRATFDIVGETEAAALTKITGSRSQHDLKILYPAPSETVEVVLVAMAGSEAAERLTGLLMSEDATNAFTAAGWQVGEETNGASFDVPRAGVLEALRNLWRELAR